MRHMQCICIVRYMIWLCVGSSVSLVGHLSFMRHLKTAEVETLAVIFK